MKELYKDAKKLIDLSHKCIIFLETPAGRLKYSLSIGQDVFVVGYPLGLWYDELHNLPIVRHGIISSAYPIPIQWKPIFSNRCKTS